MIKKNHFIEGNLPFCCCKLPLLTQIEKNLFSVGIFLPTQNNLNCRGWLTSILKHFVNKKFLVDIKDGVGKVKSIYDLVKLSLDKKRSFKVYCLTCKLIAGIYPSNFDVR